MSVEQPGPSNLRATVASNSTEYESVRRHLKKGRYETCYSNNEIVNVILHPNGTESEDDEDKYPIRFKETE